jgi:hypothetical protein
MPYRTFEDSTGKEWQVWDVVPRLTERRLHEADRRVDITPIAFADRRRDERRLSNNHRTVLRGSYAHGWLCFDNGEDKKRLSPIPGDWTACDEHTLEAYLRAADGVKPQRSFMDFGNDDRLAEAG